MGPGFVQTRQWTALVLALIVFVYLPGATARVACAGMLSFQSTALSCADGVPPSQQDGGSQSDDDSHHGMCCKCACHGLKILLSPARGPLPARDSSSTLHFPCDDLASDSPVFEIFQPPKLLI